MSMISPSEFLATLLLMALPDAIVWGLIFFVGFIIALFLSRSPGTSSAMHLFILANAMATAFGGIFANIDMIAWVAMGISVAMALFKLGNRN